MKIKGDKVLILSLYVYDLIYASSSSEIDEEFKASMMGEFSMTDLEE